MSRIRHALQWVMNRASVILASIAFGAVILVIWLLDANNPTTETLAIKIASISAFFAAVSAVATLVQAIETQRQRRGLERPYVIADFNIASDGEIDFVTQNIGNAPALNVIVRFSEPAPADFANKPLGFLEPIKFLPPGKSLRQWMGYGYSLFKDNKSVKFHLSIRYTSVYHELFQESIDYDLSYLMGVTFPEKSIQEGLENIARQLATLASNASTPRTVWSPPSTEHSLEVISKELKGINAQMSQNASFSLRKIISRVFQRKTQAKE